MGRSPFREGCFPWCVCFAVWCTEFITMGLFFSYGTIFVALVTEFGASETLAAWIGSLSFSMCLSSSFLVRILSKYMGYQAMSCLGGFLFGTGLLLSSFVKQLNLLLVTYGLIVGVGCGLTRFSAIFALPRYFEKHRTIAVGIALSGYGFGAIAIGYLTETIQSNYGLHTTFRILAAFGFPMMLGSLSYRPVSNELEVALERRAARSRVTAYSLLQNKRLLAHCFAFWMYAFGLYVPNVHLVYMAETAHVPAFLATFLPSSMAVAQSIGRVIFGHLASSKKINPVIGCQVTMFLCSMATTLCPLANNFSTFMAYAVAFGFFDSCSTIMALKIIEDLLGVDGLSTGYALQMTGTAVLAAVGPAVAGFLYEAVGSYVIPFSIAGGLQTTCVCILFLVSKREARVHDGLLSEEQPSLLDDDTFCSSKDSGIDSEDKEMGQSTKESRELSIPAYSDGSSWHFNTRTVLDLNTMQLTSVLEIPPFSHPLRDNSDVIIERETVL